MSHYTVYNSCKVLSIVFTFLTAITTAAQVSFTISPSNLLPNPSTLTASTRATLFKHSTTITVPLTRQNTFEFRNITDGSYLFTVQARDHTFGPLRVDVLSADDTRGEKIEVYQTFWGNEWKNKGEHKGSGVAELGSGEEAKAIIELRPERVKEFYAERAGFDPISFLKSPMILMAVFSLALIVGLPYITENMDEETKAEFEELQKNSALSKAASVSQNPMQNFDLAQWMASKTAGSSNGSSGGEKKAS